jgi:hypothetical protein
MIPLSFTIKRRAIPVITRMLIVILIGSICMALSAFSIEPLLNSPLPEKTDEGIPTPEAILGFNIGERFTDYRGVEKYIEAVAHASDRIHIIEYGRSYEYRPLRVLVISTPENLDRLDEILSLNRSLTDPRSTSESEAQRIASSTPVIVWLAYGVHGNEASSTEAALQTIYYLASSLDDHYLELLSDIIIVIDPVVNPDGRERFIQYINSRSHRVPNPDPQSLEHSEPWPRGRSNHYLFDLNRDWAWLTQLETRNRVALYRSFMPQVYVDYHEMRYESTYFFFPARPPYHPNFPNEVISWGRRFGDGNAAQFDRHGIPYYTGEVFDLYYPGYGDSYPTFNGAIGMTYEQAGGGAGRSILRRDGSELTLQTRALNHHLTALSTIETASRNREALLRYFYNFFKEGLEDTASNFRTVILGSERNPHRTMELVNLLLLHGIEVYRTTAPTRIRRAMHYYSDEAQSLSLSADTYVIPMQQPKGRLAKTLLEPFTQLPDTSFYDITAWSLPAAYHVEAYWTDEQLTRGLERISTTILIDGNVDGIARYAYLIPWTNDMSAKMLPKMLQRGYRIHVASRSFKQKGIVFQPGTLVVFTSQNESDLHDTIGAYASQYGVKVYATDTGTSEEGIDLGSNYVIPVRKPVVGIFSDVPTVPGEYGEVWYLFDELYEIPFTPLRTQSIRNIDLNKYTVLILPGDGSGTGYGEMIDSVAVNRLKTWISAGGTLITLNGASVFATKETSELTDVSLIPDQDTAEMSEEEKRKKSEERDRFIRLGMQERINYLQRETIAGAVFRVKLDTTHPLAFGYTDHTFILKRGGRAFGLSSQGYNVGLYSEEGALSGFASTSLAQKVTGSAFLIDYPLGRGRIIMFTENPNFRMFWPGLTKMLLNACFFFN